LPLRTIVEAGTLDAALGDRLLDRGDAIVQKELRLTPHV
jgi:hypothetical protein